MFTIQREWPRVERWAGAIEKLNPQPYLGFDLEFTIRDSRPTIIGLSDGRTTVSVPWGDGEPYFRALLDRRPDIQFVAHNGLGAELLVCNKVGIPLRPEQFQDTILYHWLTNSSLCKASKQTDDGSVLKGRGFMNLWAFVSSYLGVPNWKDCRGEGCDGPCPEHDVFGYNAMDTLYALQAFPHVLQRAKLIGVDKLYPLHRDVTVVLNGMREKGVLVNREYVDKLRVDFAGACELMKATLPFNPDSPKQVVEYFKKKGIKLENAQQGTIDEACEEYEDEELLKLQEYGRLGNGPDRWYAPREWVDGNWEGYVDDNGLVKPYLNFFTSTGRLACFSDDTEVLTKRGWVPFPFLRQSDLVAEFDRATQQIHFSVPIQRISHTVDEDIVRIKTDKQLDMLLTADHTCVLQERKTKRWICVTPENYPEDYVQYHAGVYKGGTVNVPPERLTFLAALQADGSIRDGGHLVFGFTRQRKIKRLRWALKKCNIVYSENIDASGITRFYVGASHIPTWVEQKQFTSWLLDLDWSSLQYMAREVFHWDGCFTRQNHYSSSQKENADLVQALITLTGKRARLRSYMPPSGRVNWQVDVSQNPYSMTTNRTITRVPYKGKVYCVTMPKGTVVVRRGQNVYISGNCSTPNFQTVAHRPKKFEKDPANTIAAKIRRAVVAPEGYYLYEADYSNAENRVMLHLAGHKVPDGVDLHQWVAELAELKKDDPFVQTVGGGSPRQAAKSVQHGSNYCEGLSLLSREQYRSMRVQNEISKGVRIAYPDWTFNGQIVTFTGSNFAERAFGSASYENRIKANTILGKYFGRFPGLRELQKRISKQVERDRCIRNPFGYCLALHGRDPEKLKTAAAFTGSNPVAHATKLAMLNASQHPHLDCRLQIHDSLIF